MPNDQVRDFRSLAKASNVGLMPGPLTDDIAEKLAKDRTPLTVLAVDSHETDEYGSYWDFTIQPEGQDPLMGGWPEGPRRDPNLTALMQLVQDGPVHNVCIQNLSKPGKRPYYILAPI